MESWYNLFLNLNLIQFLGQNWILSSLTVLLLNSCCPVYEPLRFGRFLRMALWLQWLSQWWYWRATPSALALSHGTRLHATSFLVQVSAVRVLKSTKTSQHISTSRSLLYHSVVRLWQPDHHLERGHRRGYDHPGWDAPWCHLQRNLEPQRQPHLHRLQGQGHPCHRPTQGDDCCCKQFSRDLFVMVCYFERWM